MKKVGKKVQKQSQVETQTYSIQKEKMGTTNILYTNYQQEIHCFIADTHKTYSSREMKKGKDLKILEN